MSYTPCSGFVELSVVISHRFLKNAAAPAAARPAARARGTAAAPRSISAPAPGVPSSCTKTGLQPCFRFSVVPSQVPPEPARHCATSVFSPHRVDEVVPPQRPRRGERRVIRLLRQIQNMFLRRAVGQPSGRKDHGAAAVRQTGVLRRAVRPPRLRRSRARSPPPRCGVRPSAAKARPSPLSSREPTTLMQRAERSSASPFANSTAGQRGPSVKPQARRILRRQPRDGGAAPAGARSGQMRRPAAPPAGGPRARAAWGPRRGGGAARPPAPGRVRPPAARARPPPRPAHPRRGGRRGFFSRQRAAQKQHAPFRCRQRKRRRGGAFLGFGGSSSTSAPSSANFTGWTT